MKFVEQRNRTATLAFSSKRARRAAMSPSYSPILIGPYSRKRRQRLLPGTTQLALLALFSIAAASVLAFVL